MKKILAPTDFSETARNSIEYATRLAVTAKAKLILFHVYQPVDEESDDLGMDTDLEATLAQAKISLQTIAIEIQKHHADSLEIECVCRCGYPVDEIGDYALEEAIDLIVMGMQGADYISDNVIGSITTALIREANCPVLVIDQKVRFNEIAHVVVACDYIRPPKRETFDALKNFTSLFTAPWVFIVKVSGKNMLPLKLWESKSQNQIRDFLHHEAHSFHTVAESDIIAGLQRFSEEKKADLMVMMPRRYSFWRSMFYSPLTKRMAFHTSIPLLILQP